MDAGTRLEHYEIVAKIGEGGMGAVYRAEDTRLKRPVAVKVLPPEVSSDAERLSRLEREAQLLASLNHPNVATIHGFGQADIEDEGEQRHVAFLVMELVEGESLYDRVAGGPMPWRDAVRIAAGIAAGLDAAHESGIVHRDLKPANVHLTSEGNVKVLDFGLAKAYDADGASGSLEMSASPTVAAATRTGLILGTAAYMSPEQARGKPVDKRADIWAVGCVLFEMLAGRKAFEGETVSDVLAAILKEEPDFDALPPLPRRLRALLERLLQKDPGLRMRDVGDVRLELEASLGEKAAATATETVGIPWPRAALAAAILLAVGLAAGWLARGAPERPPERRVMLAADSTASGLDSLAISPDGTRVAENGIGEGIRVRSADDLSWRTLPDTEGAFTTEFSADGQRIYFGRRGEVLSVGVDGSSPLVEASFPEGTLVYSLFRGLDGTVHASTWSGGETAIHRLPPSGGAQELWRGADPGARAIATAQLAEGRWIAWLGTGSGSAGLSVLSEGTEGGESTTLVTGYSSAHHLGNGEILAVDDRGRLASMRLDVATGELVRPPVVRVEGLALLGNVPAFDVADDGTLAYVSGAVSESGETLTWIDREGRETAATARKSTHDVDSRLSPDGTLLALEVGATESSPITVWIHDLERDVRSALTPGIRATFPIWSPDGRRIAVRLAEGIEPAGIYIVPVDRSEPPALLIAESEGIFRLPNDWSGDGEHILFTQSPTRTRSAAPENGLWTIPVDGGEPEVFLDSPSSEADARYSPDGRWVAYRSNQSGQYEIYLRPAAGGGEVRVSADGGHDPEWNPAGGELFFLRGRRIFSVDVGDDPARPVSAEKLLVALPNRSRPNLSIPSADGQRFMTSMFGDVDQANAVHAIFDWRRDPGDR